MKKTREQFFEVHGPSTIFIVWIVWTMIAGFSLSTIHLWQYGERGSLTNDHFNEGFPGIVVPESLNQTLDNLTYPMLFKDNATVSVYLPQGKYYLVRTHAFGYSHSFTVRNQSGVSVLEKSSSSSGGFGSGTTLFNVRNGSRFFFEFKGDLTFQIVKSEFWLNTRNEAEFSGETTSPITAFSFSILDRRGDWDHLDHAVCEVNVKDSLYNIIIFDHAYNILVNETDLEGSNTFEYNDMRSDMNIVIIETETEMAEIEISINNKEIDTKMNDYITIASVLGVTTVIIIGTGILLFGKRGLLLK